MRWNKSTLETKYTKNHCDTLHGRAIEFNFCNTMHSVMWHTFRLHLSNSLATMSDYVWRYLSAVNKRLYLPMQCQVVKTRAVHSHSYVCCVPGVHSAGCRTSWVCLQHHDTVVTSYCVKVCGSKFPPSVSKHCPHQNSATHETIPAMWNTNRPRCCYIQDAASSVQHHGSLCSQKQQSILWCLAMPAKIRQPQYKTIKLQFSMPLPADHLTLPHKMSNCQHTAVHKIQYATSCWPPHTPTQNV